jgi:hypothetical protein
MALPTQGRVLLDTTAGDIDIELWTKVRDATMTCAGLYLVQIHVAQEAPKACRNFIALAMEGTYALLPLSRPYIWLYNLYNCCDPQAIMTGSSFIGEASFLNTHIDNPYALLLPALPPPTAHRSPPTLH